MTTIVCQQVAPRMADLQANRRLSLSAIADAVAAGADIIVLPELVTSGYVFESAKEAASVAIPPDHALFEQWAAEAAGAVVVGGFAEQGDDGLVYNSAAVVDRSGVIGVYRKVHLWDREKLWFAPGGEPPRVFDTPAGRIGVLVCYDLEFPEMARMLALAGAELICVPTNWPPRAAPRGRAPARGDDRHGRRADQPRVHRLLRSHRHRARAALDRRHEHHGREGLGARLPDRRGPGERDR